MKYLSIIVIVLALLFPIPVLAQEAGWDEQRTDHFAILYTEGDQASADQYAAFIDMVYDEVAAVFGHRTVTPITLRLYPSLDRYYEANPLARGIEGVVAHADYRRHEVVVIIPQTRLQTPDEIQNNIRHELTHIVAADLSEDRLNVGFQEGLAQYLERPSRELTTKIELLRRASAGGQLLPWSALDDRAMVYGNSAISYPQSLSVVAFLVERYSFPKIRDFLTISGRSSGYRSALERTFGVPPDDLEREWSAWLPEYLSGGYRRNALTAYDLSRIETLLGQSRYGEAQIELEAAIKWLRTTSQADMLAKAEALLEQSLAGQRADALARDARAALEAADYERAEQLIAQTQDSYARLGDQRQDAVLADYARRAERGQQAGDILSRAEALAREPPTSLLLRYAEARAIADRAAMEFQALGDQARAERALALRTLFDQGRALLGGLLLLLGLGGITMSIARRLMVREVEVW